MMNMKRAGYPWIALSLVCDLVAGHARAAEAELVQSPPMSYSMDPTVTGAGGALEPRWLNATGVVGGSQYRLVVLANTAYLDMVVTQSAGAKCALRRYRSANADGVPAAPAQATLTLPVGAQSLMMRLAQTTELQYVYLYNDSATGSCTIWLQAS